jgi:hypothetical protein
MEVLRIKKLWQGCADVPSTKAQECIRKGVDLLIKFEDQEMLLTVADLTNKRKYISKQEYDKGKKPYRLWGYPWKPVKQEEL